MTHPSPTIQFTVWGTPQPGGSKRAVGMKMGKTKMVPRLLDANKKVEPWKKQVTQRAGDFMQEHGYPLLHGPLEVTYEFFRKRPKGHYGTKGDVKPRFLGAYPTTKPDLTKLIRSTEDALKGVCWDDDAQTCVFGRGTGKFYTGGPEGVRITIREIGD